MGRRPRYPSAVEETGTLEEAVYYLVLEGRQVGPYDRRTIVGMRIKGTLGSKHELVTTDGVRLTVGDIVTHRPRDELPQFQPNRSGSYSLVQATYVASLLGVDGPGPHIPAFRGEVEARVQSGTLRIAGRYRDRFTWKEDRVKLPLEAVVHARLRASVVDLWLRHEPGGGLQRIALELFTPESAGEFVEWLPKATPWPGADSQPAALPRERGAHPLLWTAVVGTVTAVAGILVWALSRH
jgi:hypothetical protein